MMYVDLSGCLRLFSGASKGCLQADDKAATTKVCIIKEGELPSDDIRGAIVNQSSEAIE